ncbi:molybdate ABC transporter permease subunit [Halocatena halophila]|uniref:molybdate ABC transporter permease subunit n=1 Tax=Halocatena halophila TaxID=2814576 RepID=UPI002ECFDEE2
MVGVLPHERTVGGAPSRALALGGLLVCFYGGPLLSLLYLGGPEMILSRIGAPEIRSATVTSVVTATVSTMIGTAGGLPLAYWLSRATVPWSRIVLGVVTLPLVLPPTVGGFVVLTVVGPNTALGTLAADAGVQLTNSLIGVVLAQTFVATPLLVVTATTAFKRVDRRFELASRSLGKTRRETVQYVTLPLAGPGILAGIALTFARAIGEFGATMMLAYTPTTLPVEMYHSYQTFGLGDTFPLALLLLSVSALVLGILTVVSHRTVA